MNSGQRPSAGFYASGASAYLSPKINTRSMAWTAPLANSIWSARCPLFRGAPLGSRFRGRDGSRWAVKKSDSWIAAPVPADSPDNR